jgi:hypothetical protein
LAGVTFNDIVEAVITARLTGSPLVLPEPKSPADKAPKR